jgi:hypothetical protein
VELYIHSPIRLHDVVLKAQGQLYLLNLSYLLARSLTHSLTHSLHGAGYSLKPDSHSPCQMACFLYRTRRFITSPLHPFLSQPQRISPRPILCGFQTFCNTLHLYGEGLLAPRSTPKAEGPLIACCPRLLIRYIRSYPPYPEAFHIPKLRRPPDGNPKGRNAGLHTLGLVTSHKCTHILQKCRTMTKDIPVSSV